MVVHIHPTLGYALVRPLIQVDGEGDGVFLPTSHLLYAEVVRVNIMHLLDGRVPLVEGPPVVNECRGSFLIRSWHILRRPSPHHRLSIKISTNPLGGIWTPSTTRPAHLALSGGASTTSASEASTDASST